MLIAQRLSWLLLSILELSLPLLVLGEDNLIHLSSLLLCIECNILISSIPAVVIFADVNHLMYYLFFLLFLMILLKIQRNLVTVMLLLLGNTDGLELSHHLPYIVLICVSSLFFLLLLILFFLSPFNDFYHFFILTLLIMERDYHFLSIFSNFLKPLFFFLLHLLLLLLLLLVLMGVIDEYAFSVLLVFFILKELILFKFLLT